MVGPRCSFADGPGWADCPRGGNLESAVGRPSGRRAAGGDSIGRCPYVQLVTSVCCLRGWPAARAVKVLGGTRAPSFSFPSALSFLFPGVSSFVSMGAASVRPPRAVSLHSLPVVILSWPHIFCFFARPLCALSCLPVRGPVAGLGMEGLSFSSCFVSVFAFVFLVVACVCARGTPGCWVGRRRCCSDARRAARGRRANGGGDGGGGGGGGWVAGAVDGEGLARGCF